MRLHGLISPASIILLIISLCSGIEASHNDVYLENQRRGTRAWWYKQSSTIPDMQGFTTSFSYYPGETISFKLSSIPSISIYSLHVFRLGYYGGLGGRQIANFPVNAIKQRACKFESWSKMTDCSNWKVSAEWILPDSAATGIYVALPIYMELNGTMVASYGSYIPFVVKQPPSKRGSDILFKTSDMTWVAYNKYGNWNVYRGNGSFHPSSRAYKASYNRPWQNRSLPPEGHFVNFVFGVEFPMLYWLEKHGYDVAYCSCADIENMHWAGELVPSYSSNGSTAPPHKVILSVGHDEYWTPGMKEAHEHARDHGVHLAFLSGNEVFWRTKWDEDTTQRHDQPAVQSRAITNARRSLRAKKLSPAERRALITEQSVSDTARSGSGTVRRSVLHPNDGSSPVVLDPQRVIVCRKETLDNIPATSPEDWTGTFRDPRHRAPEDESLLTGQNFMVNAHRKDAMSVTREDARLRFWRNASFAMVITSTETLEKAAVQALLLGANCTSPVRSTQYRQQHQHHHHQYTRDNYVVHTTAEGVLGYEWDAFPVHARPAGLFPLSTTVKQLERHLVQDHGASYAGSGTVVHRLSMYRHVSYHPNPTAAGDGQDARRPPYTTASVAGTSTEELQELCRHPPAARKPRSTALVFGAGTVQWAWALSSWHDGYSIPVDRDLAQATLNLFADMGVFPSSLKPTSADHICTLPLVLPAVSTDTAPPTSRILSVELRLQRTSVTASSINNLSSPTVPGHTMQRVLRIRGEAQDTGGGHVAAVEVSVDGGASWHMASGRTSWHYAHPFVLAQSPVLGAAHVPVADLSTAEGKQRERLFREGLMYYAGATIHANGTKLVVLSRAVDDSGWMEESIGGVLAGLCAVGSYNYSTSTHLRESSGSVAVTGRIRLMTSLGENVVMLAI